MIAVTLSLLTAAPAAPKNASAPTPIADLHDWWDGSVAWVNSHWLQIGIAVAAGLLIYFLLSLLRTLALKRAQAAPGHFTLTDIVGRVVRSEEHTSELQSLMRISYAVFCLKKQKQNIKQINTNNA